MLIMKTKIQFQTAEPKIIQKAIKPELDFEEIKIKITTTKDKITFEIFGKDESTISGAKMAIERYFKTANSALDL